TSLASAYAPLQNPPSHARLRLAHRRPPGLQHEELQGRSCGTASLTIRGGGGLSGSGQYIADGNFVVEEQYRFDRGRQKLHKVSKVKLTPAQWQTFWQTVDQSHIQKWKPAYKHSVELLTCHGYWSLDLRQDGKLFHSHGEEAYPLQKDPARSVDSFSVNDSDSLGENAFLPLEQLFHNHLSPGAKH
ncbi:MAG: hypothetical protein JWR15_4518, partial [Prosthecobacter sp.]|nr:hypothetical protein [Prosthecobacter sp.]